MDTIYGAKTIKISNGIDFDTVPLKKTFRRDPFPLNLIGVAEVHPWHAFDRVMLGIGEYYRKPHDRDIFFHIVGGVNENSEIPVFKKIIAEYGIEKYIIFHGQQFGKSLDNLFEQADFAIGSLGRHRTGIDKIKTLKNREYAARGIPFVYSETDSDFDDKLYVLKAPADESPIDMNRIIRFYRSASFIPSEIRNTVKDLSWKNQMKIVLDACFPQ
jgi:glycosyltransferase involved in cell wall biosynthesis